MVRDRFPDVTDQTELYRRIIALAGDRPVVFRTLDIGGDNLLPYWRAGRDANPALGCRALRLSPDRPFLMHQHPPALLPPSAGRGLPVLFPVVNAVSDLASAKAYPDGEPPRPAPLGGD